MSEEKKIKRRVLQGHSVLYRGEWYHQASVIDCTPADVFRTTIPAHDASGKYLGQREVDPTEVITEPEAPKSKKSLKEEE